MKNVNGLLKNNQSGFAYLLTVIVLSASVLTSLSIIYIYSTQRLRMQTKIKEAYKLLNITESAAKTVKAAWDKEVLSGTVGDSTIAANVNTTLAAQADATCKSACNTAYGINTSNITMCFANPDNASLPYCFTAAEAGGSVQANYQLAEPKSDFIKFDKFLAKMDKFFEGNQVNKIEGINLAKPTMFGWIVKNFNAQANAQVGGEGCSQYYGTPYYNTCMGIEQPTTEPGGFTCPTGTYLTTISGTTLQSCQCYQAGYVFNGSSCVSSAAGMVDGNVDTNCQNASYRAENPECNAKKIITANTLVNCNQTPKPAACAKCRASSGGQSSSCGAVSARLPGTSDSVTQTFRISKQGDQF